MSTTTTVGIVISLNNHDVTLTPSTFTDVASQGISYALQEPVTIGSPTDFSNFLSSTFGAPALPSASSLPTPINTIYNKLVTADLSVNEFAVRIPPTAGNASVMDSATFKLALAVTFDTPVTLISGALAVKGVVLSIART